MTIAKYHIGFALMARIGSGSASEQFFLCRYTPYKPLSV